MTVKEQILFNDMMELIKKQSEEMDKLSFQLKKSRENEFTKHDLYEKNKLKQEIVDLKYKLKKSKSTNSAVCKAYAQKETPIQINNYNIFKVFKMNKNEGYTKYV